MVKQRRLFVLILCLVILICGCSSKPDITFWSDPIVLKDDESVLIELPDYADSILSFTTKGILFFGFSENGADFYYYEFADGSISFLKSIPKIIFMSGDDFANFELDVFDPSTGQWNVVLSSPVNHTSKEGEYFFRPISYNGELVLLGGRYESGELVNEFLVLDDAFHVVRRISFPNEGHTEPYEGLFAYSVMNALYNGEFAYLANLGRIGVLFAISEKGEAEDVFPEIRELLIAFSAQPEKQEGRLVIKNDEEIPEMLRFGVDTDFQPYQTLDGSQLTSAWQYDDYVLLTYSKIVRNENRDAVKYFFVLTPLSMIFQK